MLHTLQQKKPETPIPNETKNTHQTNSATTKSACCCPSARHPTPSLVRRRFDCLQTHPRGEIQTRIQQTIPMGDTANRQSQQPQQPHSIHGGMDRASLQSILNSPTSRALRTLQQKKPTNTKSPTKPRLLTFEIQRQRSQRGVALQSVTQLLRSFCVDIIDYTDTQHTRVERSKYEFSKTIPMGDTANRQSQQPQQPHSIHGGMDRASPQPVERYTQFNNRNPETLNHQRNQDYSQLKSSDNEVSVVLCFAKIKATLSSFPPHDWCWS
jgi:hypothetical protein